MSKKKVNSTPELGPTNGNGRQYLLFNQDVGSSTAAYHADIRTNIVTITHHESATFTIVDTGNGYEIVDKSPGSGTKKCSIDYSTMADLCAALKIFQHNADKLYREYWTVFEGEKI